MVSKIFKKAAKNLLKGKKIKGGKKIKKAKSNIKSETQKVKEAKVISFQKDKARKAVFKGGKKPSLTEFPINEIQRFNNFIVKRTGEDSFKVMKGILNKELPTESLILRPKAVGGAIKKGAKAVVKRGRKSKRGRPKKKVETKIVTKKKQDPFKITKQKGESAEAFKKRKASITKLRKQQEKELAKEKGTKLPSTKGRTEKSMTKPPLKKEMSKARRRRLVMQRLMGTNPKTGESKDIGRMGYPTSETMRDLGYTGSRKGGIDLTEEQLRNMGFQIKKAGGKLSVAQKENIDVAPPFNNITGADFKKLQKRAGGGVALRGFGVTRKK